MYPSQGSDQTRLIFHLSYDCRRDGHKSLNHFTPKEKCTVKYRDLDYAVSTYLDLYAELLHEADIMDKEQKDQTEAATPQHKPTGESSRKKLKTAWRQKYENHVQIKPGITIYGGKLSRAPSEF